MAQHLQFQPAVRGVAEKILSKVAVNGRRRKSLKGNSKLFYVGVHVRLVVSVLNNITMKTEGPTFTSLQGGGRAQLVKVFHKKFPTYISTLGDGKLVGPEFFHMGMDYFRRRQQGAGIVGIYTQIIFVHEKANNHLFAFQYFWL